MYDTCQMASPSTYVGVYFCKSYLFLIRSYHKFNVVNKHLAQLNIPKAFAKYEFQEELKSLPTLYESNLLL